MTTQLDANRLAAALKAKRGDRGLREVAQEIEGISASTLSRIENGKDPDIDTFLRLCDWLGVEPSDFILSQEEERGASMSTPEIIEAHLRADRKLDPATAKAIADMVRAAYNLNKQPDDTTD